MMPTSTSEPYSPDDEILEPEETTDDPSWDPSSPAIAPSGSPVFNGRDVGWEPATGDDAEAMLTEAQQYCAHRCPIFEACVEDACHVYRLEQKASRYLIPESAAGTVGVLGEETIGIA